MKSNAQLLVGSPMMSGDPTRNWMTPYELGCFRGEMVSGQISFFRVGECAQCGQYIHKVKDFCSRRCKEIHDGEIETKQMD